MKKTPRPQGTTNKYYSKEIIVRKKANADDYKSGLDLCVLRKEKSLITFVMFLGFFLPFRHPPKGTEKEKNYVGKISREKFK
jgi:hypothetical protein